MIWIQLDAYEIDRNSGRSAEEAIVDIRKRLWPFY